MIARPCVPLIFAAVAMGLTITSVQAETIVVLNPSFESPVMEAGTVYGTTGCEDWSCMPADGIYACGMVNNRSPSTTPPYTPVIGVTGGQYCFLYGGGGDSATRVMWQDLQTSSGDAYLIKAGESYQLAVDLVGMPGWAQYSSGSTVTIALGYDWDGATLAFTPLASDTITFDEIYDSTASAQWMREYSLDTGIIAPGDDAVGKTLSVFFTITPNQSLEFDKNRVNIGLDNVRVTSTSAESPAVPEPSTFVLALGALAGLAACIWRKRN